MENYTQAAEKYRIYSYFYKGEHKVLPKDIYVNPPSIVVFKDKSHIAYKPESSDVESLMTWVAGERYTIFPRVEGAGLNEMAEMKKHLVIVTVDGADAKHRVKDMIELVATTKKDKYHKNFQFAWMASNDAIDSMTMSSMPYPFILVLNPETSLYYLPDGRLDQITAQKFEAFLRKIESGKAQAFGGTGVWERIKRVFYDLLTSIYSVWMQSRILFFVMFGVPSLLISLVCYGLCCLDTAEDEYERIRDEDDEEDEQEELQEQNGPPPPEPKSIEEKKTD